VSKITPGGTSTVLGTTGDQPWGITVDSAGNIYTSNEGSSNVSKITPTVTSGTPDIFPAPPAKPSAPTAAAGSPGSGTATVTVAANQISAAFGTPSSYAISATQDASAQCVVTSPNTSCRVTGLTVGTDYTFKARANLNSWQTALSTASNSVTPAAAPVPDPTPSNRFITSTVGATSSMLQSALVVTDPGTVTQKGTFNSASGARSARLLTACSGSKKLTKAGRYKINCALTSAARSARRRGSIRVTLTTTFKPTGGTARSVTRAVTLKKTSSGVTG